MRRPVGPLFVVAIFVSALVPVTVARGATASTGYLQVAGTNFSYNGQTVRLQGENFNNQTALCYSAKPCGADITKINANEADYAKLQSFGANHVRFGLDYEWFSKSRTQFYSVLDQHVAWAQAHHLWLYFNLFMPPGGSTGGYDQFNFWGNSSNQTLFKQFWQDVAAHYAGNRTVIGYDILNEPAPPSQGEWQGVAQQTRDAIYTVDPNHVTIVENSSASWDVPILTGPQVVYELHAYPVCSGGGQDAVNYPASWGSSVPRIVGEFGEQRDACGGDTSWVQNSINKFKADGIHWTDFLMRGGGSNDFGLYETNTAGDFSTPWPAMINVVSAAFAGSAHPDVTAAAAPAPTGTTSPTPSATPTPTSTPTPAASGVPALDHVVWVLMENHGYSQVVGSGVGAPYINNTLIPKGAIADKFFAIEHPSLPNYIDLTAGQNGGLTATCSPGSGCIANVPNIFKDRLEAAGKTWKGYGESMPSNCATADSGQYAVRHNPPPYFSNLQGADCNANNVPYTQLASDFAQTATTPSFSFVTPNVCNDMHDCSVTAGDTWLSQNMPTILNSPAFKTQRSLLAVVWDEDDGSEGNRVAAIFEGPQVKVGFHSTATYNHYSLLRTLEVSLGVSPLTSNDGNATPIADIFGSSLSPSPAPSPSPTRTPTATPAPSPSRTPTTTPSSSPSSVSSAASSPSPASSPSASPSLAPTASDASATFSDSVNDRAVKRTYAVTTRGGRLDARVRFKHPGAFTVFLYGPDGRLVAGESGPSGFNLGASGLAPGIYRLVISDGEGNFNLNVTYQS